MAHIKTHNTGYSNFLFLTTLFLSLNNEKGISTATEVALENWVDFWCGRRDLNPGRQRGRLMS
jgi:hypothetical protein